MRKSSLDSMSAEDLDLYAALIDEALGKAVKALSDAEEKRRQVERHRNREAHVEVMGLDLAVTVKSLSDGRVSGLLSKPSRTDEETRDLALLLLGEGQWATVEDACTDEDGTVDNVALGLVITRLLTSPQLKN